MEPEAGPRVRQGLRRVIGLMAMVAVASLPAACSDQRPSADAGAPAGPAPGTVAVHMNGAMTSTFTIR
ncbi:hypothetical protein [Rhodopila sp.]|uniref:hypothetical protein n=1 Tax=Rhodopila sp. TaxID=2480087 RepID=UPI002BDD814C|nr:hypothetical protein [Rhodopila sp.]HVZ08722.1 hypothetical protein [Rhodopila sp.]